MPAHEAPRLILEKSKTVRRRYQRSNKRFQFTASQIQRIEREEERDRKAQQLRDREKRKLANKKKKAEKEAKEREERKRLGLPNPNATKISASQPLMLNFFGKKKETKEDSEDRDEEDEESEKESEKSGVEETEDVLPHNAEEQHVAAEPEDSDTITEFGDDWFDDNLIVDGQSCGDIHNRVLDSGISSHAVAHDAIVHGDRPPLQRKETDLPLVNTINKLCESFEDDTSHLLSDLDPSLLEVLDNTEQTDQDSKKTANITNEILPLQETAQDLKVMPTSPRAGSATPHNQNGARAHSPRASDRTGETQRETDDYKENWHPNIPRDGREVNQPPTARRQSSLSQSSISSGTRRALEVLSSSDIASVDENDEAGVEATEKARVEAKEAKPEGMEVDQKASIDKKEFDIHVDTDDEYGDLDLCTQDLMYLDDMVGRR
ncbi:hypothetical protein BGW36DRAFT_374010 [Talaromyces proteolyticus]|uniref:Uncharacterized protein n=1 Tax=Talaromyces proteolyticus TaxID=1131652 RepID=A0AAD4KZY1_9EURO|nr:uncharacterized protein BGW36DRAFT_374010 [Talaromyces proteolyticus]KAH8700364.1 hypothetical protein BGW36DRAFT_374010 [Talaromyces proteolyticus]